MSVGFTLPISCTSSSKVFLLLIFGIFKNWVILKLGSIPEITELNPYPEKWDSFLVSWYVIMWFLPEYSWWWERHFLTREVRGKSCFLSLLPLSVFPLSCTSQPFYSWSPHVLKCLCVGEEVTQTQANIKQVYTMQRKFTEEHIHQVV